MSVGSSLTDRRRLGVWLVALGVAGAVAALILGIAGWLLADRATSTVSRAIGPMADIIEDMADSIEASEVLLENTTQAMESIETATRSSVRTLGSVGDVLDETSDIAGDGVADSVDAALDSLPGLISTAGVVDGTMRALSFVGVDYDPAVPLDESLIDLEESLAPVPGQIRDQVELLEEVRQDLDQIAEDGRGLSAVLLEARLDMIDTGRVLRSARLNAANAAETVSSVRSELGSYQTLGRLVAVAAALALLATSLGPLLIGLHMRRADDSPGVQ